MTIKCTRVPLVRTRSLHSNHWVVKLSLVVLNGSLLQEDPERIKDLQVDMTVLDGEIVYRR